VVSCIPTGTNTSGTFNVASQFNTNKFKKIERINYVFDNSNNVIVDSIIDYMDFNYNVNGYVSTVSNRYNIHNNDTGSFGVSVSYTYANNKIYFTYINDNYTETGNASFYSTGTVKQLYLLHTGHDATSSYAFTYNFYPSNDTIYCAKRVSGIVQDTFWVLSEHAINGYDVTNIRYSSIQEQFGISAFSYPIPYYSSFFYSGNLGLSNYMFRYIDGSDYIQCAGFPIGIQSKGLIDEIEYSSGNGGILKYLYKFDVNNRVIETNIYNYVSPSVLIPKARVIYSYY